MTIKFGVANKIVMDKVVPKKPKKKAEQRSSHFKDGLTLSDWWLLSPITRSSITLDQFCFLIMVDYCV